MLSAVIPSERGQWAVPLAGQLTHQRFVRPGPLVLGTALLKAPARMEDRDRHGCYPPPTSRSGGARSFLPGSACRHAGRTISSPPSRVAFGIWSLRIPDLFQARPFLLIVRTARLSLARGQYLQILGVSSI